MYKLSPFKSMLYILRGVIYILIFLCVSFINLVHVFGIPVIALTIFTLLLDFFSKPYKGLGFSFRLYCFIVRMALGIISGLLLFTGLGMSGVLPLAGNPAILHIQFSQLYLIAFGFYSGMFLAPLCLYKYIPSKVWIILLMLVGIGLGVLAFIVGKVYTCIFIQGDIIFAMYTPIQAQALLLGYIIIGTFAMKILIDIRYRKVLRS